MVAQKRSALGESHQAEMNDFISSSNEERETVGPSNTNSKNKFCVDYSKKETAKYKKCRKVIAKGVLRIVSGTVSSECNNRSQ